jgi:hypothetical protein
MTYAAIIHGARGINYFGGSIVVDMNARDAQLGWNWTFWERVLKPVVQEIGEKSPMNPALLVPNSKLPIKLEGAKDVDFCVREAGNDLFILAAKREGETSQVTFSGLPAPDGTSELLFESPRKVTVKAGSFSDWFAPHEVHVYRFPRSSH